MELERGMQERYDLLAVKQITRNIADLSKVVEHIAAFDAHFGDECDACDQYTVILLAQQHTCRRYKHFHQIWHLAHNPKRTQSCLKPRQTL